MYSETLKESDKSLESPMKPSESSTDQERSSDDDNEAEISEYLTLAQLGSILRELAVKGKNYNNCRLPTNVIQRYWAFSDIRYSIFGFSIYSMGSSIMNAKQKTFTTKDKNLPLCRNVKVR